MQPHGITWGKSVGVRAVMRRSLPIALSLAAVAVASAPFPRTAVGADKKKPSERFVLHGKDIVEDTDTGLRWQRNGKAAKPMNYFDAVEYAKKLELGGLTGWRLPTAEEFRGIFPATAEPFLNSGYNPKPFDESSKTPYVNYWTCRFGGYRTTYVDPKTGKNPAVAYVFHWYAKPSPGNGNGCDATLTKANVRCVWSYDSKSADDCSK